ncbi:MAG: hypothetical protein CSA33_01210 [Desulfobulbus propionicus]|nr:MAG: hypothetical protein CSA33_01210 [Desulfobulbus propionicus]
MQTRSDFVVPSVKEYVKALKLYKKKLTVEQKKMLEAHYRIYSHSLTFGQLAESIGADNYQVAMHAYEALGRLLGDELKISYLESASRPGEPLYCSAIGSGNPYRKEDASYYLVMHRELVDALRAVNWFR